MKEKYKMAIFRNSARALFCIVSTILLISCENTDEASDISQEQKSKITNDKSELELSTAIGLRLDKKYDEAVKLLTELNKENPNSPEVITQLARALFEAKQFELAAFRFDQVNSILGDFSFSKEAGLAYEYSEDFTSAIKRYDQHLGANNNDELTWLRIARLLVIEGDHTKALNAFSQGSNSALFHDCLTMANLYYEKKLLPQAEYWYQQAATKNNAKGIEHLLGLLRISLLNGEEKEAEEIILQIEKSAPGSLEQTDLDEECAQILRKRNMAELLMLKVNISTAPVSELAQFILSPPKVKAPDTVIAESKIPPSITQDIPANETNSLASQGSLASAFSTPIQVEEFTNPDLTAWDLAQEAFLKQQYQECLIQARKHLIQDSKNAEAWRLCSQAHYQLGQVKESEMTILEALRNSPKNLEIQMEYLRIARETLGSKRYLDELEKAREKFPDSIDIIWELARRYHLVERMPVTAGILYRQILDITPKNDPLHQRSSMELLKLREP